MLSRKPQRILLLVYLPFVAAALHAQPNRWSDPVNISNTPGGSGYPDMAIGPDGIIHVVWEDDSRLGDPWMNDILYTSGDGVRWAEPVQLSAMDTTFSFNPRIAVDSFGNPHVVWKHDAILPTTAIYYARLTEAGWTEPYNLTAGLGPTSPADIGIDGNDNVHVLMAAYNNASGHFDLFHRQYDGFEWLPVDTLSTVIDSGTPFFAIDSQDNLHIAWMGDPYPTTKIYYSKYDGVCLSPPQNISQVDTLPALNPCLTLDPNENPHVVWNQVVQWGPLPVIEEIFYNFFDGLNWSSPENITNLGLRKADYPQIAISSQGIKCALFFLEDYGDPYVNYSFCINSNWAYPDTMFDHYQCVYSNLVIDNADVFHACIPLGFEYFGDIGYTYFQYSNWTTPDPCDTEINLYSIDGYPNPFNISSMLSYRIHKDSRVVLDIYNTLGQTIRALEDGIKAAGIYELNWNGLNQFGKEVSAGTYIIILKIDAESSTKKLVLMR